MSKIKKIIIIVSASIFILAILFFFANRKKQQENYITEKAVFQDLKSTVSVTGELVSNGRLNLNFETAGRIVSAGFVGQKIAQGDTIGRIDDFILNKEAEKSVSGSG